MEMRSTIPKKIFKKKKTPIRQDAKCKLEIMQLHGQLYQIYLAAVGSQRIKAAYWPKEKHFYTYVFWLVNLLALLTIPLSTIQNANTPFLTISAILILAPTYYILKNICIETSLETEFKKIGVERRSSMQLPTIQYELLRTMWFFEMVMQKINPSVLQVEKCIEFSETIHKDALPFTASYFRHPLTILFFGAIFYIFNLKMSEFVGPLDQQVWRRILPFFVLIFWILVMGYHLHGMKFHPLDTGGKFLRSLRWILIEMKNNDDSAKT
jgi:hypothetical protein